jgi:hypothetical protein
MTSQIQMANLFFIYPFMFSLSATVTVTTGTTTDIYCVNLLKILHVKLKIFQGQHILEISSNLIVGLKIMIIVIKLDSYAFYIRI